MMKKYYVEVFLLVALIASVVVVGVLAQEKANAQKKVTALIAENKALTGDVRKAKVAAFRDGIITCTNEDVDYFNEMSIEYPSLAEIFDTWAQNWSYDEDTLNVMTEEYMEEGTH